jgi:hypothetical protein
MEAFAAYSPGNQSSFMRPKPGCSPSAREASNHGSASKRKRAAPVRYSARTITDAGRIVEIAIGENLEKILARARSHHRKCGQGAWVWNVRTGETIIEIGKVSTYAACA